MDRFITMLKDADGAWEYALTNVGDTAYICRAWLQEHAPAFTTADLLAMTRLVIEQQEAQIAREQAG